MAAKPRIALGSNLAPSAPAPPPVMPDATRRFVAGGNAPAVNSPATSPERKKRPGPQPHALNTPTHPISVMLPKPLQFWLARTVAHRKIAGYELNSQKDVLCLAIYNWLAAEHPELQPDDFTPSMIAGVQDDSQT